MKLDQLNAVLNGVVIGPDVAFKGVSIDTRTIKPGNLFVAIKGEQFDGHDFIEQAIAKGASAVIAEGSVEIEGASAIIVADTIKALGQIAAHHRRQYNIPCIGVTGSCGKTTVRSITAHICALAGKTLSPTKNFNNHIGLPLTLLELDDSYDFMVLELGASGLHEIAYLSEIARPTISTITNIHPAHLEGFGSIEGIVQTKGEIYEGLPDDGIAVLNLDGPYTSTWREKIGNRKVVTYSKEHDADIRGEIIAHHPDGMQLQVETPKGVLAFNFRLPGPHNLENVLCSIALLQPLDIPLSIMKEGLESFAGVDGRMKQTTLVDGTIIVDDTYNANPGSMTAALNYLKACQGPRILVMGDMAELGQDAQTWHVKLGEMAKDAVDSLVATGPLSRFSVEAFGKKGQWYETKSSLIEALSNTKGATILVKGSRSAQMELVVSELISKRNKQA